jgi:hypothetical protein
MKKVFAFIGCALFVAAMTVSCGNNNNAANDSVADTIEAAEPAAEPVEAAVEADNSAMLAAAAEAGQKICECTKGDATSIENCMKSVIEAGYQQYQGNDEFAAAVRAEIDNCIKAKVTNAAKDAANEGIKAGAKALSDAIKK